jgi:hypothetical protein
MIRYQHRQTGALFIGIMVAVALVGAVRAARAGNRLGTLARNVALPAIVATLFGTMSTTIGRDALTVAFGPGLIHRTILLDEIDEVNVTSLPWYAGIGLHWMPGMGWIFNVAPGGAIEIRTTGGERLRVGSDEPEALRDAIREAIDQQ